MRKKRFSGSASTLIAAFVLASCLVAVLGVRQASRLFMQPAWVAIQDLKAGAVLSMASLEKARTSVEGGVEDLAALVGKQLKVDKNKGEAFTPQDIVSPTRSRAGLASVVPEGRVVYSITPSLASIPYTEIKYSDSLDVMVSRGSGRVFVAARDAHLMGVHSPEASPQQAQQNDSAFAAMLAPAKPESVSGKTLVLAVRPTDIYALAGIQEGDKVSLVLHSEADAANGDPKAIVPSYRYVEVVNGVSRSTTAVQR